MIHKDSTIERVRALMAETLRVDSSEIADTATPEEIPTWDSVSHMMLITALEAEFDVHFTMNEVWTVLSLEELVKAVDSKS